MLVPRERRAATPGPTPGAPAPSLRWADPAPLGCEAWKEPGAWSAPRVPGSAGRVPTPLARLPARYVISSLELLVAEDYMIVYLNGATPRRRMPGLGWLKKCYQMIDRR